LFIISFRPIRRISDFQRYGEDLGVKQLFLPHDEPQTQSALQKARDYFENVLKPDSKFETLVRECRNEHESCAFWASLGECESNPNFMNVSCGPVCQSCEYKIVEFRCPLDPNAIDAFYPGDLDRMFENITTLLEYSKYEPKVWSRPSLLPGDTEETAPYKLGPWLITLENFVSNDEAKRLIELGANRGYQRSTNTGPLKFDGTFDSFVDEVRTSSNSWCENECYNDTVAKAVHDRIVNLTGVPEPNMEFLQLLHYEVGQYYRTHHDYIAHHITRREGVRVLTVYLYLNDVDEGGGTSFPNLDVTVMPKLGRVVVWPSVLNENPNEMDQRTEHQALPVERGVKYGTWNSLVQKKFDCFSEILGS
jgi:prolyl 4-hydroxylase